jgi:hypothetical protein
MTKTASAFTVGLRMLAVVRWIALSWEMGGLL